MRKTRGGTAIHNPLLVFTFIVIMLIITAAACLSALVKCAKAEGKLPAQSTSQRTLRASSGMRT